MLFTGPQPICGFERGGRTQTPTLDRLMGFDILRYMVSKKSYCTKMMQDNRLVLEVNLHIAIWAIARVSNLEFSLFWVVGIACRRVMPDLMG